MSAGPIRAVVCDFFGVLTTPLAAAFEAVRAATDIPPSELNAAMGRIAERTGEIPLFTLECGRMTQDEFHRLLEAELTATLGRPISMAAFNEIYFGALALNAPVADAIARAREAGFRTSLLTNNVLEWEPYWRAMLPVETLFDDVVDSAYVGLRKPDPEIFRLAASRLDVAPAECVFVDDFPHNCDAARELGMTAVVFDDADRALGELDGVLAARGEPVTPAA